MPTKQGDLANGNDPVAQHLLQSTVPTALLTPRDMKDETWFSEG